MGKADVENALCFAKFSVLGDSVAFWWSHTGEAMIVTIEEARETMCPLRFNFREGVDCIGPKCMAWRATEPSKGFCGMVPVWPEFKRGKE